MCNRDISKSTLCLGRILALGLCLLPPLAHPYAIVFTPPGIFEVDYANPVDVQEGVGPRNEQRTVLTIGPNTLGVKSITEVAAFAGRNELSTRTAAQRIFEIKRTDPTELLVAAINITQHWDGQLIVDDPTLSRAGFSMRTSLFDVGTITFSVDLDPISFEIGRGASDQRTSVNLDGSVSELLRVPVDTKFNITTEITTSAASAWERLPTTARSDFWFGGSAYAEISVIPEPNTLALTGLVLSGLGFARCRRRTRWQRLPFSVGGGRRLVRRLRCSMLGINTLIAAPERCLLA